MLLDRVTIYGNNVHGGRAPRGGGIHGGGYLALDRSWVGHNLVGAWGAAPGANGRGGGINLEVSGQSTVTNTTIEGNLAAAAGAIGTQGPVDITHATIARNASTRGGALHATMPASSSSPTPSSARTCRPTARVRCRSGSGPTSRPATRLSAGLVRPRRAAGCARLLWRADAHDPAAARQRCDRGRARRRGRRRPARRGPPAAGPVRPRRGRDAGWACPAEVHRRLRQPSASLRPRPQRSCRLRRPRSTDRGLPDGQRRQRGPAAAAVHRRLYPCRLPGRGPDQEALDPRLAPARHPERQQQPDPGGAEAVEGQALVHRRDRPPEQPGVDHRAGVEGRVLQRLAQGGRLAGLAPGAGGACARACRGRRRAAAARGARRCRRGGSAAPATCRCRRGGACRRGPRPPAPGGARHQSQLDEARLQRLVAGVGVEIAGAGPAQGGPLQRDLDPRERRDRPPAMAARPSSSSTWPVCSCGCRRTVPRRRDGTGAVISSIWITSASPSQASALGPIVSASGVAAQAAAAALGHRPAWPAAP